MSDDEIPLPTAMIAHAIASIRTLVGAPEGTLPCEGWEGPCSNVNAARQRQNTAYADDSANWVVLCPECMRLNDAHWQDMWDDYYAGCM